MAPRRLSLPAAEPLLRTVAASLADRIHSAAEVAADDPEPAGWAVSLDHMTDNDRIELTRHAVNAVLEILDSRPACAAELLPRATSAIQAQIARGCVVDHAPSDQSYLVAEIDVEVWQQLLSADRRNSPLNMLASDEAAERKRLLLTELGISEADVASFRSDQRVAQALPDLTQLALVGERPVRQN